MVGTAALPWSCGCGRGAAGDPGGGGRFGSWPGSWPGTWGGTWASASAGPRRIVARRVRMEVSTVYGVML